MLQASLILALGAQNLFVIEVSLKRKNHLLVASICAVSDFILISIGVLGVSFLLIKVVELKIIVGSIGVAFLILYAFLKFKEAIHRESTAAQIVNGLESRKAVILGALGFTFLNPHVYMDTFFLVGGYSARFDSEKLRILFGLGAGSFSILWFYFLAIFTSCFSDLLRKEKIFRTISLLSGIILSYLSVKLGIEVVKDVNIFFSKSYF